MSAKPQLLTPHVLCVEPDEDICSMIDVLLGQAGYNVVTATTVAAGVRLAQTGRFSLLIVGSLFEDGTGVDLCQQVRKFDSGLPILLYSSISQSSDMQEAVKAGAQGYLTKPNVDDLLPSILRLLNLAAPA